MSQEVVGEAVLRFSTDRSAVDSGLSDVEKSSAKSGSKSGGAFAGAFKKAVTVGAVGITAALGVGGVLAGRFVKDSIAGASDLNETIAKTQVVFGDAAAEVGKFADAGAASLGLSKQAALDAQATFGVFGKSAGLVGADLSGFSGDLTSLAVDMASFSNTTPEEAIVALSSALRGESEPIRAYGVLLDDAGLRQEAMRQGLIKTTKDALTPQQKVLASQALIMKQTADAQGDFARTSEGLANQQRILGANVDDLKARLGTKLLPVMTSVVGVLNDMVTGTGRAGAAMDAVGNVVGPIIDFLGAGFHDLGNGVKVFVRTLRGEGGAIDTNGPFVKLGLILGDLVKGALPAVIDAFQTLSPILVQVGKHLVEDVQKVIENLTPIIAPLVKEALSLASSFRLSELKVVGTVIEKLGDGLVAFTGFLGDHAEVIKPIIVGVLAMVAAYKIYTTFVKVAQIAVLAFQVAQLALNVVMSANPIGLIALALVGLAAGLIYAYKHSEKFREVVDKVFGFLKDFVPAAIDFVVGFVKDHWGLLVTVLLGPMGFIIVQIIKHFDTIKAVISAAIGFIVDRAKDIGQFAHTVIGGVRRVVDFLTGIPDKIADLAGRMKDAGKDFIAGLFRGITGAAGKAGGVVADIASDVFDGIKDLINGAIDLINAGIPNSIGKGFAKIDLPNDPIPHLARGTSNWQGGWSWVGEEGPELVNLPRGATVVPAQQSQNAAGAANGQGGVVVQFTGAVQPHNYSEFLRQATDEARRAGLGTRRPILATAVAP